jgi:hypothetical protein
METKKRSHKNIKFTGDYSKLLSMGFKFQKLYANNYMQWEKETQEYLSSVRVWKKGSQITIDSLTNYEGFFLDELLRLKNLNKPINLTKFKTIQFVKNPETFEISFEQADIDYVNEQTGLLYKQYNDLEKILPLPENFQSLLPIKQKEWQEHRNKLAVDSGMTLIDYKKSLKIDFIDPIDLLPLTEFLKLGWAEVRTFNVEC